jgi:membrane peptidoglycan carboxypeptidase
MTTRATRLLAVTLAGGLVLAGLLTPVAAGIALVSNGTPTPAGSPLPSTAMPAVTTVLDRDGHPIAQLDEQYRIPVPISGISPAMQAAAVAIEDRRFYDEAGVDPVGTLRALATNALGGATQGGSTITQQYVKNYLINVVDRNDPAAQRADRSDTLGRKVREAELATGLAHTMSKNDVLDGYLNVGG